MFVNPDLRCRGDGGHAGAALTMTPGLFVAVLSSDSSIVSSRRRNGDIVKTGTVVVRLACLHGVRACVRAWLRACVHVCCA